MCSAKAEPILACCKINVISREFCNYVLQHHKLCKNNVLGIKTMVFGVAINFLKITLILQTARHCTMYVCILGAIFQLQNLNI